MTKEIRVLTALLLSVALLWGNPTEVSAGGKKRKEEKYAKVFKDDKVEKAVDGFLGLYKKDGKLYLEIPKSELGSELLLGAALSSVSDGTILTLGMKSEEPLLMSFELRDSTVVVKKANTIVYDDGADEQLKKALSISYRDPYVQAFPIEAYAPDSSAFLIDATNLLARENKLVSVIPKHSGEFTLSATPESSMSFIKSLSSFEDNVQVRVELNYKLSATMLGMVSVASDMPTTVEATFTLIKLPKEAMPVRVADTRVGTYTTTKLQFRPDLDKSSSLYLANRYRLIPRDLEAYQRGELVAPIEPIVLYLDPTFPEDWKEPIRQGVLQWQGALAQAGFKDALRVVDYPTDVPDFDPDNLKYSCIRYIPNGDEEIYAPSWVDPRTGEIIASSLLVSNNIEKLFYKWYFTQSALVDPSIRNTPLPKERRDAMLTMAIAHEIGHILGLQHNMLASSAYRTKDLRDPAFVAKHGISPSIMDYVRLNYVAQPEDRVPFVLPQVGPYDKYVVEWLYRYFPEHHGDIDKDTKVLQAMVDKKSQERIYQYLPEQSYAFDPRVIANDLGDDPIESSTLAIKNLQQISHNFPAWIKDDEDSRKKDALDLVIAQQFHQLLKNVMHQIGGIQVNPAKPTKETPLYTVLPKEVQRSSLRWCVDRIKEFKSYGNQDLERMSNIRISYYDQLFEFLINDLYNTRMRVLTSSHIVPGSYSQAEWFADMSQEVFRNIREHRDPTHAEILLQRGFINLGKAEVSGTTIPTKMIPAALKEENTPTLTSFGDPQRSPYPMIRLEDIDESGLHFMIALEKLLPQLERAAKEAKSAEAKAHYSVMVFKTKKALEGK